MMHRLNKRGEAWAVAWALLAASLLGSATASAQRFEGIISFESTSNDITTTFDYYVKGTRVRIESSGAGKQGAAIIMDANTNLATMLVPGSNMYMEFDLTKSPAGKPKPLPEGVVLTRTGRTQKIAGQECEEYAASSPSMKADVWAVTGFGSFRQFDPAPTSPRLSASLERKLVLQGLFPLRMIVRDLSGKVQSKIEAKRIRRQTLDSSLFSVPRGWQRMDLNMMPKQ